VLSYLNELTRAFSASRDAVLTAATNRAKRAELLVGNPRPSSCTARNIRNETINVFRNDTIRFRFSREMANHNLLRLVIIGFCS